MYTRREFLARSAAAGGVVGLMAAGLRPGRAVAAVTGETDGFVVPSGQLWELQGDVVLRGDVTVEGTLRARAGTHVSSDGPQRVIFVQNGGTVDLQGPAKAGWNRTGTHPTWSPTDEVLMAPTAPGEYAFSSFVPGRAVPQADPSVPAAEVFNLTRDLTFTGVRFHFHMGAGSSTLRHLAVIDAGTAGVLGEYPLHWHRNYDTSRGTLVEGVLVRGGRNHAFVPHASHGITFRDCVAYDTTDDAFWWDPPPTDHDTTNNTVDVTWEHCLVALVNQPPDGRRNIAGFHLGAGIGNTIVDSAVAGVQGEENAAGYVWPSSANHEDNVWIFRDNVAHNNVSHGVFVWQNDDNSHVVEGLVTYRNAERGINWGAYRNPYLWVGGLSLGEPEHCLAQHINGKPSDEGQVPGVHGWVFDGAGLTPFLVRLAKVNKLPPEASVTYLDCTFRGWTENVLLVANFDGDAKAVGQLVDFVNLGGGTDLESDHVTVETLAPGTRLRSQRADGTAWEMDDQGQMSDISAFYAAPVTTPSAPTTTSATTAPEPVTTTTTAPTTPPVTTTTAPPDTTPTTPGTTVPPSRPHVGRPVIPGQDAHSRMERLLDAAQEALEGGRSRRAERYLARIAEILAEHSLSG